MRNKTKNRIIEIIPYLIIVLAIVMPWFLESGYLFLTDMSWGPVINLDWRNTSFLLSLIIKGLSFILPIDFLEKVFITTILIIIILGGRTVAKAILRLITDRKPSVGLIFVLSLFSLFNPFVYDRALYGQLGVLLAYGLLFFTFAYLINTWQSLDFRHLYWSVFSSALAITFAANFIFLLLLLYLLFFLGLYLRRRELKKRSLNKKLLRVLFISVLIALAVNANWLIAIVSNSSSLINLSRGVTQQDLFAFQTIGENPTETIINVAMMSGFWGKEQYRYTDLTKIKGNWGRSFYLLLPLILWGLITGLKDKRYRALSIGLLALYLVSVFLALGIKAPIAREFTLWLFDHFPFYKVFREPQKWVALVVLVYSVFLTIGTKELFSKKIINNFEMSFKIENAQDRKYQEYRNYLAPSRTYTIEGNWRF